MTSPANLASIKGLLGLTDTREMPDWSTIPGIGLIRDGRLVTMHVTDNPVGVLRAIRRKQNVVASYGRKGKNAELGPGLYFSDVPELWAGRAREKWSFLSTLSRAEIERLWDALDRDLSKMVQERYINPSEAAYIRRLGNGVIDGQLTPDVLTAIANQPYNVAFWKESYLKPLGIRAGAVPTLVTVEIRGVLAWVCCDNMPPATWRALRRLGAVGAYKVPGMSVNPEMVLWDTRAIVAASSRQMNRSGA